MIIKGEFTSKYHIKNILNKMSKVNKWQYNFLPKVMILFLSIKGKINFLQLERYSDSHEQHYRNQFEKEFDFLKFNINLVQEHAGSDCIIAFDPSYVSKSGKSTPGVGYFWSGCAGKAKWGLEIGGIGAIDLVNHTAFHLEAVQTVGKLDNMSLLDHYAQVLIDRKDDLFCISNHLVADAYFSKEPFVTSMCNTGFEVISRLRNDADLRYLFKGEQRGGKGRPKQYSGKIYYKDLDKDYFENIETTEDQQIYHAVVNSKSLKRNLNLVIVYTRKADVWSHKLYFSTDLNLSGKQILRYYRLRFQIEFIYRDGKQHTGFNDCQARSENKLNFHFNTALTAVNIAKITHWLTIQKQDRGAFSIADVKTIYHNKLLLDIFIEAFAINTNSKKNQNKIRQLTNVGTRAA
jgi:hypothetical protein